MFFYPLDFTFVCPSELIALDHRMDEFKARNVEVIGVSIDSHHTHSAWRNTAINDGGIGPVKYTLAADMAHNICRAYDVELADGSKAYRGAFIRKVQAAQYIEANPNEVCPASWKPGAETLKPSLDLV